MATRPRTRPSSRYIQRLYVSLRRRGRRPAGNHHHHHLREEDDSEDEDDPPPLNLHHPILRAIDSAPTPSRLLDKALAQLFLSGLHAHPLAAGRAVLKLASSSSSLPRALALFSFVPSPDAFFSNTLLRAFLHLRDPLAAFGFVLNHPFSPNHFSFPLLAKLFAELRLHRHGCRVHAQAVKMGFEADVFVRNAMIHMYSCFGDVAAARRIFGLGFELDLVSWNSMVDGYVKNGMVRLARELFDEMPKRDVLSWNVMLSGHAAAGEMAAVRQLFDEMPEKDVVSWNTVIDGHANLGEVKQARELFDEMPERNLVSWNVILAMYARIKDYRECLKVFDAMIAVGYVLPNQATFVSVLTACANLSDLERGKWIHSLITIKPDVLLSTALLTMYAKCGVINEARKIFDQMGERSVVSWNAMITGYGMHGNSEKALETFLEMEKQGVRPNETTFICTLSACAHAGMLLEGWWCFHRMIRVYKIQPKVEHFGCMVDLLGRAGLLTDSEELAKQAEQTPALWGALLSASRTHSDCELAEMVSKKMMEMEPKDMGAYVILSNTYASLGRWKDVEKVREIMVRNGVQKPAGVSLVNLGSMGVENVSASRRSMVYSMLGEMGARFKSSARVSVLCPGSAGFHS